MGAGRDARLAPAIRQGAVVNRLVSHTRRPARRRGTQTLARWGLAATLHGHRHVRDLGCGLGRRPFREVIRPRKGGAFPGRPGTYVAGWQRCPLSAPTLSTATTRVRTAGTSSPSRTPHSCSLSGALGACHRCHPTHPKRRHPDRYLQSVIDVICVRWPLIPLPRRPHRHPTAPRGRTVDMSPTCNPSNPRVLTHPAPR